MDQVIKTLIIDDSLAQCQILREHLLHFGISIVDYCHDGHAALELLAQSTTSYDALFIDLHMEGMDGLELMHTLNQLGYKGAVVIMSSLNRRIIDCAVEVVSNYDLRLLGSIEKPIERSLVAFMVRRIGNAKHAQPPLETLPKQQDITKALRDNRLFVHFQPVIDGNTNSIHTLECLSRLEIPGRGLIEPLQFIPIVERFDLFEDFTEALFKAAAPAYERIQKETGVNTKISFNLSPQQLSDDALPSVLNQRVNEYGMDKSNIGFEITENYSLAGEQQQKNLSRLSISGFRLSLDDYGTGYTNLRQVTHMPFSEIKLDADLVVGMHRDKVLKIIVESVSRIAREIDVDLVAESINNPHDLIMLDAMGIHLYQGYFFARPKNATDFISWFEQWRKTMEESQAFDREIIDRQKTVYRNL